MELIIALFASAVGAFLGYLGALHTQNIQFEKQKANNFKIAKSQLSLLEKELLVIYDKLFVGDNQLYCMSPQHFFPNCNEFDTSNKEAMWLNLINTNLIITHQDLFTQINSVYRNLKTLNQEVKTIEPIQHDIRDESNINFSKLRNRMDEIRKNYDSSACHGNNLSFKDTMIGKALHSIR